jgi:RNA polymerase sigma-70 factor (ECF subfamily)
MVHWPRVPSDSELLSAWAAGDRAAGEAFYGRYADRVARFFTRKTPDDAADLLQRTFLKCLEACRAGTEARSPVALLFAIARNELYDRFKARLGERERFSPELTSLEDLGTGALTQLLREEQQRLLAQALARLPLDHQLALELYYWEGLAMEELTEVLGITRSAAINRIHRARAALREHLAALAQSAEIAEETATGFESWSGRKPDSAIE